MNRLNELSSGLNGYFYIAKKASDIVTFAAYFKDIRGEVIIYKAKSIGNATELSVAKILGNSRKIEKEKRMGACLEILTEQLREELKLKKKVCLYHGFSKPIEYYLN